MNTEADSRLAQTPLFTPERIEQILSWWQQSMTAQSAASLSPAQTATLTQHHRHLMEVFCVVKAGGVAGQIEAAQALLQREQAELEADLAAAAAAADADRVSAVNQELRELHRSIGWRIDLLQTIHPQDEALVQTHLSHIERVFAAVAQS
ncbi:hypothetical protein [Sphaerothrix gracilis]|uniref:hypothetical protein n=1 Tax=Sphaerothrix gracilis TaxID=3151835 RepID=UPI0031FC37FA